MPQMLDPREDARTAGARSHPGRVLGPYETSYDVRRGYTAPSVAPDPHLRRETGEVWSGRARDER